MTATALLTAAVILAVALLAALVVLTMVACASTDHRDVRWAIIGVLVVVAVMAVVGAADAYALWGR